MVDLTVSDNTADDGGGIYNHTGGILSLDQVTISGNSASDEGGGLYNTGTATVGDTTLSGNAAVSGGGIYNTADLTITGSTLSENTADNGGGFYNDATVTLTNVTISGNSADTNGGGIYQNTGTLTATNVTVSNNRADSDDLAGDGGGIYAPSGTATLHNTIAAGNVLGTASPTDDDVSGTFDAASSYNLIGVIDGSTGLVDAGGTTQYGTTGLPLDAKLAALGDYGGPTETHALLSDSPALDNGDNTKANDAGLTTDQRGFARIVNTTVDVGASRAVRLPFRPP